MICPSTLRDDLLRGDLRLAADDLSSSKALTLALDPAMQGLPDVAHGGTVLALFDALANRRGMRRVDGRYLRRVPLGAPLQLHAERADGHTACRLLDGSATVLVEGEVRDASGPAASMRAALTTGEALPVTRACFVCGVENAHGLGARLSFDEETVWTRWTPGAAFRTREGALSPVAVTSLLDETAFWLGALAAGESGMTTELRVTLGARLPFGATLTVAGARRRVRPRADDPRYLETAVTAIGDDGRVVASAAITFVAVRGAARRLVAMMRDLNPAETLRRVFPAYVPG